jgi:hypothetical protein
MTALERQLRVGTSAYAAPPSVVALAGIASVAKSASHQSSLLPNMPLVPTARPADAFGFLRRRRGVGTAAALGVMVRDG